ncbi:MAG: 3-deoxy-manno-octulosonate cytidylyltransferase [Polyangiales bacterium]
MDAGGVEFRVVVPARYAASRLPGKPLRDIAGRPLVVHVLGAAQRAGASEVVVAVDDDRIHRAVEAAGGRALMTSPDHPSGTDRLAEVAATLEWPEDAIVVNLQGDEPLVPPELVAQLASALHAHPEAGIATMATPINDVDALFDSSVVKVVLDDAGFASYFSRAPIPWVRDRFDLGRRPAELPAGVSFLRHLGMYAYRVGTLERLAQAPRSAHEQAESLEQLRALALGIRIHVTQVAEPPPRGVDTEADLERTRRAIEGEHSGRDR